MCRMMGIVAPHGVDAEHVARFRQQARGHVPSGDTPGHADGWGIVHYEGGRPAYTARSTADALTDPLYEGALDELRKRRPTGPLLAHVRKASAGAVSVENTHPFTSGRWAFCHNGTVFGLASPGESDSRALFALLLRELDAGAAPREAIAAVAERVSALRYTSLTFLLTDGRALWGVRKLGNVDEECREGACDRDYYTLGVARIGDQTVVSQEHEFLAIDAWHVVPDGHVVVVPPDGHPRIEAI
ncbi:MAG TPA: class II glutamine amidotransferase [Candidatus Thermoplasmatota archaeon]|nr:class II glutamine amidotransferase [Candidatus Thermoplasmatota archaeon]